MSIDMPEIKRKMDFTKTTMYKVGRAAERKNLYFVFCRLTPDDSPYDLSDCFIRAIAMGENVSYETVEQKLLNRLIKVGYRYVFTCDTDYLDETYHRISCTAKRGCKRITGKDFAETHKHGRYILRMAHHLTACVDGKIYDTWDCTDKTVYSYWTVSE